MTKTVNLEEISREVDIAAHRLGFRDGEMRILLNEIRTGEISYAICLKEIYAYFYSAPQDEPVTVRCSGDVGSFGWRLTSYERKRYKELFLQSKYDRTRVWCRVIAASVEYRSCVEIGDRNWPG